MNEVIQNILNRRSVRVYKEEQIKQEDLDLILKAGYYAPSGCNLQPWHFTVIQNKELLKTLNTEAKKEFINSDREMFRKMAENEQHDIFYNALTVIVMSGEKTSNTALIDCSAATQNMMLAAESLGIGSCWIGLLAFLFRSPRVSEFAQILKIPEGYEPYFGLTLGYKKYENGSSPKRREGVITYIK